MAPIKRHEALVSFSRDHHNGLLLVWKIGSGLDKKVEPERIGTYVSYAFEKDLKPHFAAEEQWLFPLLPADNPRRQQAEADHRAMTTLAGQIKEKTVDEQMLKSFAELLNKHIRFEERELFNEIQQIPEEKLLPVAERFKDHYCEADDGWTDKFWENPKQAI